jgi:hypothetical protein
MELSNHVFIHDKFLEKFHSFASDEVLGVSRKTEMSGRTRNAE